MNQILKTVELPGLKDVLIKRINDNIDIPKLSESTEEAIIREAINALYDCIKARA